MSGAFSGTGGNDWFSQTRWTVVWQAKDLSSPEAARALEELCRGYWRPVFTFIRSRGYSKEDAEDLTQDFFAAMLNGELLVHLKHDDGRFRAFLLKVLSHRLSDDRDKKRAQKRGSGMLPISLDAFEEEERAAMLPSNGATPAELFDRCWAHTVLRRTQELLAQEFAALGKSDLFAAMRDLHPSARGDDGYINIAKRFSMTVSAFKSAVHRMRKRHKAILIGEVAKTVAHGSELEAEIEHLLKVVA